MSRFLSAVRALDQPESRSTYRPDIDGLRALAVISVIIDHLSQEVLPGGFLGVDIFFVISGFVITSTLYRRPGTNLGDLVLSFYVRRVKRLVPALVLCVVITGIAICLFNPTPGDSLSTGIAALFGLSNIYLLIQSTDYFGASAQLNVFTHTWSLGVEEQFYLLFPLVIWCSGFGRRGSAGLRIMFGLAAILAVCSAVACLVVSRGDPATAFFLMPTRLWELMAGCLTFIALTADQRVGLTLPYGATALAALLSMVAVLHETPSPTNRTTLAIVLLTGLSIFALRPHGIAYRILCWRPAAYVGRISYSLYLWHWPVVVISRWTIGIHGWTLPFQVGLMVLFAAGSFHWVEQPLRHVQWSPARWRSVGLGVGALASGALVLLGLMGPLDGILFTGKRAGLFRGPEPLTAIYTLPDGSSWRGERCVLSNDNQVGKTISIDQCTLGDFSRARRRVLVIGNSYSAAFVPGFDDLVLSDGFAVTITSSWGASPVVEIPNETPWRKANSYYWSEVVPSLMSHLHAGDWVFLVAEISDIHAGEPLEQFKRGLIMLSDQLHERGIGLAVLKSLPFARQEHCGPSVAAMRQWFTPFDNPCHFLSRSATLAQLSALSSTLEDLEHERKLAVVDLMDVFCPDEFCTYAAKDGELLYRDSYSHASIEAARLSAPLIRRVLLAPN